MCRHMYIYIQLFTKSGRLEEELINFYRGCAGRAFASLQTSQIPTSSCVFYSCLCFVVQLLPTRLRQNEKKRDLTDTARNRASFV